MAHALLATARRQGYDFTVLAPARAGVSSPMGIGATTPPCDTGAFFAPALFNGGRCWEAERLAGSYSRSANPISSATIRLAAMLAVSLSNRSPHHV